MTGGASNLKTVCETVFETLRLLFLRGNDQEMSPEVDVASRGEAVDGRPSMQVPVGLS